MTAVGETAWYVYAVLPEGAVVPRCAAAILPGAALAVISGEDGGLAALVSLVPRALFAPDHPASRAAEPDWVAARAAAHHDVVAQAFAEGSCLPLGFGTLFASGDGVRAWLAEQAPVFHAALAQVASRQEWAVTLAEDPVAHAAWVRAHDAAVQALAACLGAAGPGASFLLTRRLDRAVQTARAAHAEAIAGVAADRLAACGAVLAEPPAHGAAASWSVLAAPGDDVPALVAGLTTALAGTGLTLRATGPWPPYAFTRAACQGGRDA